MPDETLPKKQKKIKPVGADGHRSRMLEKFINCEKYNVLPRDVIEMLLFYPIRIRDTRDAAVLLMEQYDKDIIKLLTAPTDELCSVEGVGHSSAVFLNMVGALAEKLNADTPDERPVYTDCDQIGELFMENYNYPCKDEIWIAVFDNAMHAVLRKIKTDSRRIDTDDIYELISCCAQFRMTKMAVARFASAPDSMPTMDDISNTRFIESRLSGTSYELLEYYVVNGDAPIRIKKLIVTL